MHGPFKLHIAVFSHKMQIGMSFKTIKTNMIQSIFFDEYNIQIIFEFKTKMWLLGTGQYVRAAGTCKGDSGTQKLGY